MAFNSIIKRHDFPKEIIKSFLKLSAVVDPWKYKDAFWNEELQSYDGWLFPWLERRTNVGNYQTLNLL